MAQGSLGDLFVRFAADTAQFQSDVGKAAYAAEQSAKRIDSAMATAGKAIKLGLAGFTLDRVIGEVNRLADQMAKLDDQAQKGFGNVADLSRFQQVLKITGASIDSLDGAFVSLTRSLQTSDNGFGNARRALEAIGLNLEDIRKLNPAQQFEAIGKALEGVSDGQAKLAISMALFRTQGPEVLKFLKDFSTFGSQVTPVTAEAAEAASKYRDQLRLLTLQGENLRQSILSSIIPSLTELIQQFLEGKKAAGGLFEAIRLFGTINPFESVSGNLKKERDALEALEKDRTRVLSNSGANVDTSGLDSAIDSAKKRIEFLKSQQRAEVLAAGGGDTPGEKARFLRPKQIDFQLNEKRPRGAGGAGRRPLDLDELEVRRERALQESLLTIDKQVSQQRLAALDEYHRDGALSVTDYYARRREIVQSNLQTELADLDALLKIQTDRQTKALADIGAASKSGDRPAQDEAIKRETAAQIEITKLLGKKQEAQIKASGDATRLYFQEKAATDELRSSLAAVNAQLLEFQGNSEKAAAIRFDEGNRKLAQSVANQFGAGSQQAAALAQLRELTIAQAGFNQEREKLSQIQGRLALEEERIQNSLKVGAIGEFEALQKTGEARRARVAEMQLEVDKLSEIAEKSKNPALILQAQQAQQALANLRNETDLLGQKFQDIFSGGTQSGLNEFYDSLKRGEGLMNSFKNAMRSFADSIVKEINSIVFKDIGKDIAKSLGIGPGGEGGGLIPKLISGAAGIFGGTPSLYGPGSKAVGGTVDTSILDHPEVAEAFLRQSEQFVASMQNLAPAADQVAMAATEAAGSLTDVGAQAATSVALQTLASAATQAASALYAVAASGGAGAGGSGAGLLGSLGGAFAGSNTSLAADSSLAGFENFAALAASGYMHSGHGPGDPLQTLPRYHGGTGVNAAGALRADEQLAVILKSESVLRKDQMKELIPIDVAARALAAATGRPVTAGGESKLTRGQRAELGGADVLARMLAASPRYHDGTGPRSSPLAAAQSYFGGDDGKGWMAGGDTNHVNININGGQVTRQTALQVAAAAETGLTRARRRGL